MAKIFVTLQPHKYPSGKDIAVEMELSEDLIRKAFVPLDLPNPATSVFARMVCSSDAEVAEVTASREVATRVISAAVTEALVEILSSRDTVMGYAKSK